LTRKLGQQLFTHDCLAAMFGEEGIRIALSLHAFSLPVAIIHSSELIEQRIENKQRLYRYLLTDIGRSLSITVQLTADDKIASLKVVQL